MCVKERVLRVLFTRFQSGVAAKVEKMCTGQSVAAAVGTNKSPGAHLRTGRFYPAFAKTFDRSDMLLPGWANEKQVGAQACHSSNSRAASVEPILAAAFRSSAYSGLPIWCLAMARCKSPSASGI